MATANVADRVISDGMRLITIVGPVLGVLLVYFQNKSRANAKIFTALICLLAFFAVVAAGYAISYWMRASS